MRKKFTNDSFEEFLQQSADAFEMRPSSKVWQGIAKKTNRRRRKYYLTFSFLISSFLIGFLLLNKEPLFTNNIPATKTTIPVSSAPGVQDEKVLPANQPNSFVSKNPLTQNAKRAVAKNNSLAQDQSKSIVYEYWQTNLAKKSKYAPRRTAAYSVKKIPAHYAPVSHLQKTNDKSNTHLAKVARRSSKFSTQLFVTPTIGYEKKSYSPPAAYSKTVVPADYSVNNAISQMPDIGLELGFTSKYRVAKNLRLRGGFQFNINRYNIRAFGSPGASANPLDYGSIVDSVNGIAGLSEAGAGAGSTETGRMEDFYLQVAAPVGMEIKFYGNEKMQFGIASTVQPTYMFGNRTHLVTTDLKSFAQTPLLARRWNLNTSFETFASYSTGSVQWQVGPQVRYQIFSSFVNKYPVKENLFDFGLKVGVSFKQQ